jgi:predicted GIY-YIG superfamily endonuclease
MPATQSSMAETLVADLRTLCVRVREALWKRWRRSWKIALIDKFNPDWRDLAEELAL